MAIEISWSDQHIKVTVGSEEEREALISASAILYNECGDDTNPMIRDLSRLHLIPKIIELKTPTIKD